MVAVRLSADLSTRTLPGPDNTLRETLPNGLTVLIRENPTSPSVVINGYVLAGAEDEPRDKAGLASLTADVMARGTYRRPFSTLYEQVESIGASFDVTGGTHLTFFGAKGLSEHLSLLLDILADVLQHPAFEAQEVEKAREEALITLQERAYDTRQTAQLRFRQLAYPPEHPYHWSQLGYPETIRTLSREDLLTFHATYVAPQGGVLAIVGDVQPAVALKAVDEAFGSWQKTRPPRQTPPRVLKINEPYQEHVTLAGKSQTSFLLGWIGPSRYDADFIPCHVANTILGVFGMYGRLGQRVREQHGLAYYIHSHISGSPYSGPWWISAGLSPGAVEQAKSLILEEIRELQDRPINPQELDDSQAYLVGGLPLALETNEGIAGGLISIERYGLGLDYFRRYNDIIYAVTPQDIQRVAQTWLDSDHYIQVTAGPELHNPTE